MKKKYFSLNCKSNLSLQYVSFVSIEIVVIFSSPNISLNSFL